MNRRVFLLISFIITAIAAGLANASLPSKIQLKVLYVGLSDTPRANSFKALLEEHFTSVTTANYYTFKESKTENADVVILDKDGVEWKALDIKLSDEYSKPTITIGTPGAFWCDHNSLKIRYM